MRGAHRARQHPSLELVEGLQETHAFVYEGTRKCFSQRSPCLGRCHWPLFKFPIDRNEEGSGLARGFFEARCGKVECVSPGCCTVRCTHDLASGTAYPPTKATHHASLMLAARSSRRTEGRNRLRLP